MANCTVSGTFTNPQGTAISGATIRFNIESPVLDLSGNLLLPKEITTTTATDGTWSLSIIQGVAGNLVLELNPASSSPVVRYNFSMVIPSTTTATFASCWADSGSFGGQSASTPLTFADIAGTLATAQLPALPATDIWVGDASGLAAPVAMSGDGTLDNAGALTVVSVGGSTAANVHSAELAANAATALNTASAIVKRDSSGDFAAHTVTATGNVAATGTVTGSNLSGTNTGDVTLGTFGASPNNQGASIAAQVLQMQPADATNPGGVSTTTQTFAGNKTFSGTIAASNYSGTSSGTNSGDVTLASVGAVPAAAGASLSGQVLTLQPADGTNPGVITAGTQTIGGAKTFSGAISASNLSGTNTGDITLASVGSSPAAAGASLSSQVLTLQPADGTNPGVVTAVAQTLAGAKTFSTAPILSSLSASLPLKTDASKNITAAAINLSGSEVTGNLGVSHLNSGTSASSSTFWRGDGTWAAAGVTLTAPTIQKFTSGTGTYTTAANVLYIRVRMVGGGGGGGCSGTSDGTAATDGTASTFGSSLLSAGGGSHGARISAGGSGGTSSLGSGPIGTALSGAAGSGSGMSGGTVSNASSNAGGGAGGNSFFGGGGAGGYAIQTSSQSFAGGNGIANTGGGGGGAGIPVTNSAGGGSGGGAGGFVDALISSPAASYSYTVGGGGNGQAQGGGTGAAAGGNGGSGYIEVTEYYQ